MTRRLMFVCKVAKNKLPSIFGVNLFLTKTLKMYCKLAKQTTGFDDQFKLMNTFMALSISLSFKYELTNISALKVSSIWLTIPINLIKTNGPFSKFNKKYESNGLNLYFKVLSLVNCLFHDASTILYDFDLKLRTFVTLILNDEILNLLKKLS